MTATRELTAADRVAIYAEVYDNITDANPMSEHRVRARDDLDLQPDPVIDAFKRDVDRTLIREQLRRSIDERPLPGSIG